MALPSGTSVTHRTPRLACAAHPSWARSVALFAVGVLSLRPQRAHSHRLSIVGRVGCGAVYCRVSAAAWVRAMELLTILNRCHRFRGFVYHRARFSPHRKSIEVLVRPRKGSAAICSRCHHPARGYDQLAERRFEFIPLWGFFVFLLYAMRRVDCRRCGAVIVEEVPWADGKRTLTKAYMLFLARWAPPFLERNGRSIPHFLGKGFRRGRACRHLGAGTPDAGPDRRHRR